jgi:hypothetical protein
LKKVFCGGGGALTGASCAGRSKLTMGDLCAEAKSSGAALYSSC